jgi:hypothetical protein
MKMNTQTYIRIMAIMPISGVDHNLTQLDISMVITLNQKNKGRILHNKQTILKESNKLTAEQKKQRTC